MAFTIGKRIETAQSNIDSSFVIGSGFLLTGTPSSTNVRVVKLQSDGKILVGGNFNQYSGVSANYIIRLNSDGSIDNTFNTGAGFNSQVYAIELQSDGKILVGGSFTTYSGVSTNYIARLNTGGTKDNTFSGNSFSALNTTIYSIAIQSSGKIIFGGGINNDYKYFRRLTTTGDFDNSFCCFFLQGSDSAVIRHIVLQSTGKIVAIGDFFQWNIPVGFIQPRGMIRFDSDGNYEVSSWNSSAFSTPGNSLNLSFFYGLAVQSDGKVVIGGDFTTRGGATLNRIARLTVDGATDTSFNSGTGFNGIVTSIAVQSDGKILVGGSFSGYNGNLVTRMVRLNSNGSIDSTGDFNTNCISGFDNNVNAIAVQSDGKIICGGEFTTYSGNSYSRIIRLNSN